MSGGTCSANITANLDEAQELGLKIVTYMRDRANQFSEQYQHNYSVLATPAEGLSGKFTRIDRKKFGIAAGHYGP